MWNFRIGKIPFKHFEITFIEREQGIETWKYNVQMLNHQFSGIVDIKDSEDLLEKIFIKIRSELANMLEKIKKGEG